MSDKVSIKGLNRAAVLMALYNASKPQGMGFLHYDPKPMTEVEAETHLVRGSYFDYLNGRVMKIDIKGDELDPWGYDRDNGQGAVAKAIATLRQSGDTNAPAIKVTHTSNMRSAAVDAEMMGVPIPAAAKGKPHAVLIEDMPETKVVKLKNGAEEAEPLVRVTFMVLRDLMMKDPIVFFEFTEICKNPKHKLFGNTGKKLNDLNLVREGVVHGSVRNIVLSAIKGEGLDICLVSPIAA